MMLTNVRLVWFSISNDNFNISIPWLQIKQMKKRDLKNGSAIIIETWPLGGGYIVGYQSDQLDTILQEI
jgi:Bardet-Biedl syndrome 5 protein